MRLLRIDARRADPKRGAPRAEPSMVTRIIFVAFLGQYSCRFQADHDSPAPMASL